MSILWHAVIAVRLELLEGLGGHDRLVSRHGSILNKVHHLLAKRMVRVVYAHATRVYAVRINRRDARVRFLQELAEVLKQLQHKLPLSMDLVVAVFELISVPLF